MMQFKFFSLLRLRLKQIARLISTVGYGLLSVFLVISIGISFPLLKHILEFSQFISIPGTLATIMLLDFYRKDKMFLLTTFDHKNNLRKYLLIEYTILTTPVWSYQMFSNFPLGVSILFICFFVAWISPFIKTNEKTSLKKSINSIPLSYFELKFFVEKNSLGWFVFWLMGLGSFFHIGIYVLWMVIILLTMPELFRHFESRDMLQWKYGFISEKIFKYYKIFTLLSLLHTIIAIAFHPEMFLIVLYLNFCLTTALFLNISMKYASYTPVFHAAAISNINALMTLLMLFPGGIIITLVYSFLKYSSAEKNLKSYYA